MPVVVDNTAKANFTSSTNSSLILTMTTSAVLLVGVGLKGNVGKSVSAVYANGVAMTQLRRVEAGNGACVATLFGMTAPPSGNVSISVELVGAAAGVNVWAASYANSRTTFPFTSSAVSVTNVPTFGINISSSANDVAGLFVVGTGGITASNATTRQFDTTSFGFYYGDTAGTNTVASFSVSSSTSAGANYGFAAIAFNVGFSAAATTSFRQWRLLTDVGF